MQLSLASVLMACAAVSSTGAFARTHDFNGDGRDDVAWRNADTGANAVWLSGNAATPRSIASVGNTRWTIEGIGDFDGDGQADLFWRQRSSGANVIWRSGNAATTRAVTTAPNLDWHVVGVGDFNGDGRSDLFWRNLRTGANQVWFAALSSQFATSSFGVPGVLAGIGDFDGDGKDDLLWRNPSLNLSTVWPSATPSRARNLALFDAFWQVEGVGDFDGDGRDDVVWRRLDDGRNVLWPAGDAARATNLARILSGDWHIAAVGDYDGNGRDDLFWHNDANGRNVMWPAASAGAARAVVAGADSAWSVVPFEAQPTMPWVRFWPPAPVAEGNSGTKIVVAHARLSHPNALPMTLSMTGPDGPVGPIGASPGVDFTWLPSNAQRTFAPWETTVDIPIPVNGDTVAEANETIPVFANQATGAFAWRFDRAVTLLNDDANTLWIDNARLSDEFIGLQPMHFVVHLSRAQGTPVTFTAATTTGGLATPNVDYVPRSAALTIPAGATQTTFDVNIIGDTVLDAWGGGEGFGVRLTRVTNVLPVVDAAYGTITDRSYRRTQP